MRKLLVVSFHSLLGVLLAVAPLHAEQEITEDNNQIQVMTEEQQEAVKLSRKSLIDQRAQVGIRSLSQVERVAIQEERAQQAEEGVVEEVENESSENQAQPLQALQLGAPINSKSIAKPCASYYYTSHPGAIHYPVAVSFTGDTIELEDGSLWAVRPSDAYKTLNWILGDTVFILPNDWFSIYSYRIVNQQTGAVVNVNLAQGPIYNSVYTHWVVGIDYWNEEIWLEDGTKWKISSFDYSTFKKWALNDTVIIGINDDYMASTRPNILINVNMLNYCRAKCY